MACCRCNRTRGLCKSCVCAKVEIACSNCFPSRDGHCYNPFGHSSPTTSPRQAQRRTGDSRLSYEEDSSTSDGGPLAPVPPNSSALCGPCSFDNPVSNCNLNTSSSYSPQSNHVVGEPPSCIILALPQFREMSDPVLSGDLLMGPLV